MKNGPKYIDVTKLGQPPPQDPSIVLAHDVQTAKWWAEGRHIKHFVAVSPRCIDRVRGFSAVHFYNVDQTILEQKEWEVVLECFAQSKTKPRVIPCNL